MGLNQRLNKLLSESVQCEFCKSNLIDGPIYKDVCYFFSSKPKKPSIHTKNGLKCRSVHYLNFSDHLDSTYRKSLSNSLKNKLAFTSQTIFKKQLEVF